MILLDGKKLAEEILKNLKKEIKHRQLKLKLAVVLVGDNAVSKVFIEEKKKAAQKIGMGFAFYQFKKNITEKNLVGEILKIVQDSSISGIIIQLPLPVGFNVQKILNLIPQKKDIDVLSAQSYGKFKRGKLAILPPTTGAIMAALKNYKINLEKKNIVIVGAGRLVGKPMSDYLKSKKIKHKILDKSTKEISVFTKKADILISGTGSPRLIKGEMIKEGVAVIDVGSSVEKGRGTGDVDFKSVSKKAGYIAPVPGGIGPLTVACLLDNLIRISKH